MNIAGINYESMSDAEGVACVIYISGCKHKCKGCHNPQTHDFNYGIPFTNDLLIQINSELKKRPFLNAIVLSGGDPMYSAKELINIIPQLYLSNKKVWCYSGFLMKEIQQDYNMNKLLNLCDVLVDGLFQINDRDITLPFRGSSNQKLWRKKDGEWILWQ